MKTFLAHIIERLTKGVYHVTKPFFSEEQLRSYKPIHLCWWFIKNDLEIPEYFIAGMPEVGTVVTVGASNIEETSFDMTGEITDLGTNSDFEEKGFAYLEGTTGTPDTSNQTVFSTTGGLGEYTLPITGLTPETSYRVRAYYINSAGTAYGDTITVTTAVDTSVTFTPDNVAQSQPLSESGISTFYEVSGDSVTQATIVEDSGIDQSESETDLPVTDGLVLDLDATKLNLNDDDLVELWEDSSGIGNDAIQNTDIHRPVFKTSVLNGLPVVRFNEPDEQRMEVSNNATIDLVNAGSIIVIFVPRDVRVDGPDEFPGILAKGSNSNRQYWLWQARWENALTGQFGTQNIQTGGVPVLVQDEPSLASLIGDTVSNEQNLWHNGSLIATNDAPSATTENTPLFLGFMDSFDYWTGDIAQIAIYNRVLTTQEREDVENYLTAKWIDDDSVTIESDSVSQSQSISDSGVEVNYSTLPDDISQSTVVDETVITVDYTISVDNILQTTDIVATTIDVFFDIITDNIGQSEIISEPDLNVSYEIISDNLLQNQLVSDSGLEELIEIVVNNINQGQTVSETSLLHNYTITVNGVNQGTTVEDSSISFGLTITPNNVSQSSEVSDSGLNVSYEINTNSIQQQTIVDQTSISFGLTINPLNIEQGQSVIDSGLSLFYEVGSDNINQNQTITDSTLEHFIEISVDNVDQNSGISGTTIGVNYSISTNNVEQVSEVSSSSVGAIIILSVDNVEQETIITQSVGDGPNVTVRVYPNYRIRTKDRKVYRVRLKKSKKYRITTKLNLEN